MAGLLVLAACGEKGGTPQQQATMTPDVAGSIGQQAPLVVPSKTMGATSFNVIPKTACTGTQGEPVTWILGDIFDGLNKAEREIGRDIKRPGNKSVPEVAANKLNGNWPTNLDMDVSTPVATPQPPKSDYVLVTIELRNKAAGGKPGVYFMRAAPNPLPDNPPLTDTDSSVAVMAPPPGTAGWKFCGRTDIKITNDTESITFGIMKDSGTQSLNIGLLVPAKAKNGKTPYWLPIFLDPNMRNEG
jgi:hypothetical protein